MELNRNQYFMIGLICLFFGIQVRMIDSVVLNQPTSRIVSEKMKLVSSAGGAVLLGGASVTSPSSKRTVSPPRWLGWALFSVGAVLVLHSLAMKRPE